MSDAQRLPAAAGASPRYHDPGPETSHSEGGMFPMSDTAQELKMLNWYKLANEAAMKAALVKHKRYKEVPKYNPAAERVRQRATWMEQVQAEEQNKPLELRSDVYQKLMQKEEEDKIRLAERTRERHDKIVALKSELQAKEGRKVQYRRFLAEQEKQRRKALSSSGHLDAIYGDDHGISAEQVGMSVDTLVTLENLDRLEQRVSTILKDDSTQVPGAIVLDLTRASDVGVTVVHNADASTLNAEQVTFIKRRTEPRLNQPSQVMYRAKLLPASQDRKEAVTLRNEFAAQDVPPHVQDLAQTHAMSRSSVSGNGTRSALNSRGGGGGGGGGRGSAGPGDGREPSREELRAQQSAEVAMKRQAREETRQKDLLDQERVDEVIKDWLRGRNRRALKREKKIRDVMRNDRRFLSQLQVTKDSKYSGGLEGGGGSGAANNTGWTPNFSGSVALPSALDTEDIDRRLEVLLQQQKQMEKWKPRVAKTRS